MIDLGPAIHPERTAATDLAASAAAGRAPATDALMAVVSARLSDQGYARLGPADFAALCGAAPGGWDAALPLWNALPADAYLRDGGHYRSRRHASLVHELADGLRPVAHRAHFQPETYNALHGGLVRWYQPLDPALTSLPVWEPTLLALGRLFAGLRGGVPRWFVEAHQFRIDTRGGVGRPTPEGAHRDGVDFVAVILAARHGVRGGETRVFELDGPHGVRFTLDQPWSALLMDDTRVIHESTPIVCDDESGWRDTLVLTWRAGGFLDPAGA